jgi:hypothetical protein
MQQITLPKGAFILPADVQRIEAALADLKNSKGAHDSLSVQVSLHVHHEYPKHVTVGEEEDGTPLTKIVNSPEEESAASAEAKPKAHSGPKLVAESPEPADQPAGDLTEMSKADRKQELGGMTKAELLDVAEQHNVQADSSMNKGEITSALNKQLNKEAKTGTE